LPEGEIEIKKPEGSTGDPYRDYAIQRLEREVEKEEQQAKTWQEKYDQLWEMFSRVTANSFHRPVRRTA
jgi:pyrroloquinoline quinone (PQQ) biosynthesis protein C